MNLKKQTLLACTVLFAGAAFASEQEMPFRIEKHPGVVHHSFPIVVSGECDALNVGLGGRMTLDLNAADMSLALMSSAGSQGFGLTRPYPKQIAPFFFSAKEGNDLDVLLERPGYRVEGLQVDIHGQGLRYFMVSDGKDPIECKSSFEFERFADEGIMKLILAGWFE